MNFRRILFTFLITSLLLAGCGGTPSLGGQDGDAELVQIRLPMGYIPSVQYAPLYAADHSGFFEEVGLEVEFDYSYETDGVALVASNELQFSLASGEQILLARAEGLPVVYAMAWYQNYPVAVVSKSEQGIQTPADLAGKHIGIPGLFGASYVGLRALLDAAGLQEEDVILDSIGFNQVEALAADQVEAAVVYVNNEPYKLQELGYDVGVISVADYAHLVSNGLITNETTLRQNPDLVRRMVQAFIRGIKFTVTHPAEAYVISQDYVEGLPSLDEQSRIAEVERYTALYQTDPYGYSDPAAWDNMQAVLFKMGLLSTELDLQVAFTNDFVE
ncbi:MAG: ABC transporter substrate-binding protein [Anaerolineales bacterium]|nr:ABC transporter substrate-binding protein [Anaerolineales bacterium]